MLLALKVCTVLLVAGILSLAMAHALELPGTLRLEERTYLSVQTIYYLGFTIGGAAEPLAAIATLALLFAMPKTLVDPHCLLWSRGHANRLLGRNSAYEPVLVEKRATGDGRCSALLH